MISAAEVVDAELVSPGIGAFLTFFALALVVILIARSFTVHMRRIKARAAQEDAAIAEQEADSVDPKPSDGGDHPPEERT